MTAPIVDVDRFGTFSLDEGFLDPYRRRPVPWGFGALSWVTYQRTYSRGGEQWWQTCRRVIEGMFTVARAHCLAEGLGWDAAWAREFAQEAYRRLWRFQWTPPGRGLWIMGTDHLYRRGGAALNNCGFISTKDLAHDFADPFTWMLQMSMQGVGVGFDTRGKGAVTIAPPPRADDAHTIGDSREGWAEAVARLLNAYAGKAALPASWDYSAIRPAGKPLESFGGVASGPGPLEEMVEDLTRLFDEYAGDRRKVDARLIVDTMNIIGRCVVAGGVRRSAQIAFGDPGDTQFLDLKQDRDKVMAYRWAANNSVFAHQDMDYDEVARRTAVNGEPGYFWLQNAQAFGRMKDEPSRADEQALGSNPCVEQTLWDRELCCLVETYPAHHDSYHDYERTLEVAFLYAKTVTLVPTEDTGTNAVMLGNRRMGCSMTGVVQAVNKFGYRRFLRWCDEAYGFIQRLDDKHSQWLGVPRSIKTTSVKPSGTVSLLAGATPGVHWEHAPYYLRRIRVQESHPLGEMCREAGYPVEPDRYSDDTVVVSFPVALTYAGRRKADVPVWEKVDLAAQMQRYWSDNQVSCTAEFDPEHEADALPHVLSAYEDRLKAIVFLPGTQHGYAQPPYEEISPEEYREIHAQIKPIGGDLPHEHELEARYCEGGACDYTPG
jgi:adenosylcobalamin-dependent ribonucleoside-triphosphate reductase